MRHRKNKFQLSRKKDPRRIMIKQLAEGLILHEQIKTTQAKAKAIRPYVEKLITRSGTNNLANRRYLLKALPTDRSVKKLLEVLGPKYVNRPGGYLRMTRIPQRAGDGARMVVIEMV